MSSDPVEAPALTSEEFRRACGRFATGVTIASVMDSNGTPHGLTVSSFTSVSLEPPLVLICLGHQVTMIETFRSAAYFGINVLTEEQQHLSERFAQKGHDRFIGVAWHRGKSGVPLIENVLAAIECEVYNRFISGDHDILVGRMLHADIRDGRPLLYYASRYGRMQHDS